MPEYLQVASGNPFAGATRGSVEIVDPSEDTPVAPETPEEDDIQDEPINEGNEGQEDLDPNAEMENGEEDADQEKPTEPAKPKQQVKQSATAEPAKPVDLKPEEVVSKFDKKALLQAMGLDEFAINAIDHYQAVGNLDDYLAVKSVNFKEMTSEQLMRYDYAKKYPKLSEAAIDFKVKNAMVRDYGLDPDMSEDELKVQKEIFDFEMEEVRAKLMEEQAKFSPPPRQQQPQYDPAKARQDLLKDPVVSSIVQSKALAFGPQDEVFNYGFDPEKVLPLLYDDEALDLALSIKDEYGKPTGKRDPVLAMQMAAFAADPVGFVKSFIDHGKSLGRKGKRAIVENPSASEGAAPPRQEKTVFDALRRRGVHTGGSQD